MPNQNSAAGHIPIRTCVVCRRKAGLPEMLSFVILSGGVVFDIERVLQTRHYHLCGAAACMDSLAKWKQKRMKKCGVRHAGGKAHA